MKTDTSSFLAPSHDECIFGLAWLGFQLLFLPSLLFFFNDRLAVPLGEAQLNLLFFSMNFGAVLLVFHRFLLLSVKNALQAPLALLRAALLGLAVYVGCRYVLNALTVRLFPAFENLNDASLAQMRDDSFWCIAIGTVLLVPTAEECLYRGMVFGRLYGRSPAAAFAVSTLFFAAIHVVGYLGSYETWELALVFLQYLPAGLYLGWSYCHSGTVITPIFMHTIINITALLRLR